MAGRWGCIEESCSLRKEACSGRQSLFYFSIVNFAGKKKLKFKVLCSSFKVLNAGTMRWWNVLFMIIGNYCFGITFFHFYGKKNLIFVVFCSKLTCFYIWRTTFVNRGDSAALQFFIKCCFGTRFQLYHTNCSSCNFDIAISIIYWLIVQP